MPYTLRFSDPAKLATVTVPDMPPGINTIDTSLNLVGKNYPNYGEKIAQSFLNLLENFSGPLPPEKPIEGQLWYDTSDPNNKVLRVMDGTANSARWPSANGIYQQGVDPKTTAVTLKVGDIWVDTQNNLLKIYHSGNWTTVGPAVSSGFLKTGVEPVVLESIVNTTHNVIVCYIDGNVASIISTAQFTPRTIIDGFTLIRPGINISTNFNSILNGISSSALSLRINDQNYAASSFLLKDDQTQQLVTGKVFFQTPTNQLNSEGRDGIVIDTNVPANKTYIQLYKLSNDAVLLNNTPGGKILFKTKASLNTNLVTGMTIENNSVSINTSTNALYALDIFGSVRISGNIIISSTLTNSLLVSGSTTFQKDLIVNQSVLVNNVLTATNLLSLGSVSGNGTIISPVQHEVFDIGSTTKYFRSLYVKTIGSTGTGTTVYGRVIGPSTGLEKSSEFKLQGQVTATSFIFAGTGTQATFNTALTPNAIVQQQKLITATNTLNLLVIDTSTSATYTGLRKIDRRDFLKGIVPVGMIAPYAGSLIPSGWLECDGQTLASSDYPELYAAISPLYKPPGPNFRVPDMRQSTTSTLGFVTYIIKI